MSMLNWFDASSHQEKMIEPLLYVQLPKPGSNKQREAWHSRVHDPVASLLSHPHLLSPSALLSAQLGGVEAR